MRPPATGGAASAAGSSAAAASHVTLARVRCRSAIGRGHGRRCGRRASCRSPGRTRRRGLRRRGGRCRRFGDRRGQVSPVPAWRPVDSCRSGRCAGAACCACSGSACAVRTSSSGNHAPSPAIRCFSTCASLHQDSVWGANAAAYTARATPSPARDSGRLGLQPGRRGERSRVVCAARRRSATGRCAGRAAGAATERSSAACTRRPAG